ncbi:hypothetical protein [Sinanaerobacter sp. ZZT-01]|uniref:hypothetical protein n=1 Tax=Sinanaerobacter sp. ZZT-01 TaxID=3111540 RepID=UPI002D7893CA|nr:hypothetical protein [Sinanaerobacter sp. ZZT-01]WRR92691.1 hypothetical protein U5921_11640 [Sinanaerobacter sp. ZZT-01]
MKLNAKSILQTVEIQAIEKEMDILRDQYFYDAKHEDFNALYYEFLEATNKDGLSLSKRLSVCEGFFLKAVAYMNLYYPDYRMDVDLLTFGLAEEMPKQPKNHKNTKTSKTSKTSKGRTKKRTTKSRLRG